MFTIHTHTHKYIHFPAFSTHSAVIMCHLLFQVLGMNLSQPEIFTTRYTTLKKISNKLSKCIYTISDGTMKIIKLSKGLKSNRYILIRVVKESLSGELVFRDLARGERSHVNNLRTSFQAQEAPRTKVLRVDCITVLKKT